MFFCCLAVPSPISFSGEMRVQLLNQTLLDLGFYDDGPFEVADQKQLNAQLIPVPYHSYLGRTRPPCSLLPEHSREREGLGRMTPGLKLHQNMADLTTGSAANAKFPSLVQGKLLLMSCSFLGHYFWPSVSVYDS